MCSRIWISQQPIKTLIFYRIFIIIKFSIHYISICSQCLSSSFAPTVYLLICLLTDSSTDVLIPLAHLHGYSVSYWLRNCGCSTLLLQRRASQFVQATSFLYICSCSALILERVVGFVKRVVPHIHFCVLQSFPWIVDL